MTAAETPPRWVEFAGTDNVRDLGGLEIPGTAGTRFGLVYRASTLQELTGPDRARLLDELGVRTIIDLRSPDEVRREGYGLLADAAVLRVNLPVRKATPRHGEAVPDSRRVDLVALYRDMLAGSAESLVAAARIVADTDQHAVLFHCAGGKDRTGILAAVLCDAIGVPADVIVADYALTAQRLDRIRERLLRLPSYRDLPSVREGVLTAEPDVMGRFLAHLHGELGGAAAWLIQHGLTEAELAQLRATLVGPV